VCGKCDSGRWPGKSILAGDPGFVFCGSEFRVSDYRHSTAIDYLYHKPARRADVRWICRGAEIAPISAGSERTFTLSFSSFFPYPKRQLYLPLGTQNPTHQSYWVFCCCFISSSYLLRVLCEMFFRISTIEYEYLDLSSQFMAEGLTLQRSTVVELSNNAKNLKTEIPVS